VESSIVFFFFANRLASFYYLVNQSIIDKIKEKRGVAQEKNWMSQSQDA
jgi:hypothetical protein